ncbi:MAG: helix-turn-helix domain-containing protein [Verrucomicrobiae bacterium]|nr:helix-turn-helix domain-containing protein [Verrucomicrobiae bacterium]
MKDLNLQPAQRRFERALARYNAVTAYLAIAPKLGATLAINEVVAAFKDKIRISAPSLRRWVKRFQERGFDGLFEDKVGKVGRKPYAKDLPPEDVAKLRAAALDYGVISKSGKPRPNIARAFRELISDPTVIGPARRWLHSAYASKSYVPPSVRAAARVPELAAKNILIGPRAAKLDGPFTICSYDNLQPGDAFTADDFTANVYVWTQWNNAQGFIVARPQILAVADVASQAWLNARVVIRPRGQYCKDDVWGLIGECLETYGLFKYAILEGGAWQSNIVIGERTGISDEMRFGGLLALGIKVIRARGPHSKIIETMGNQMQYQADNVPGFAGRHEMRDRPELIKKALAAVQAGAHPGEFFMHVADYARHIENALRTLNAERNDGRILRGRSPADAWAEVAPERCPVPDQYRWLFRSNLRRVLVTANGVRVSIGSGKNLVSYYYAHPALEKYRGMPVLVFWNDSNPDVPACIFSIRAGQPGQLICIADRVQEIPRIGASREEIAADAHRKKLAWLEAVSYSVTLGPYLRRRNMPVATEPNQISTAIATAEQISAERAQAAEAARRAVARVQVPPELDAAVTDLVTEQTQLDALAQELSELTL